MTAYIQILGGQSPLLFIVVLYGRLNATYTTFKAIIGIINAKQKRGMFFDLHIILEKCKC